MSTTLTVLIQHNVESVYFFCSNPVQKNEHKVLETGSDSITDKKVRGEGGSSTYFSALDRTYLTPNLCLFFLSI